MKIQNMPSPKVHTAPKESFGQGIPLGMDSFGGCPSKGLSQGVPWTFGLARES